MTRRAILFGIGSYRAESGLEPLDYPSRDAELLREVFVDHSSGMDPSNVYLHSDVSFATAQRRLFDFLKNTQRDDVAIIHYSGHGVQDAGGDLYLCFVDTRVDELEISALPIQQLRRLIDNRKARRVLITLDCCYSAKAGEQLTRDANAGVLNEKLHEVEEDFGEGHGVYVLSAAGRSQTAKEDAELGAGVFTWHMANGIRTGAADLTRTGKITVSDLASYLQREVPKDAARQNPHLDAENVSGTFVIANNRSVQTQRLIGEFRGTLTNLQQENHIGIQFAAEVDRWLDGPDFVLMPADPRWDMMVQMHEGEILAADFQSAWREHSLLQESHQPVSVQMDTDKNTQDEEVQADAREEKLDPKPDTRLEPKDTSEEAVPTERVEVTRLSEKTDQETDEAQIRKPILVSLYDAFMTGLKFVLFWIIELCLSPICIFAASIAMLTVTVNYASNYSYDARYYLSYARDVLPLFAIYLVPAALWQVLRFRKRMYFKKLTLTSIVVALVLSAVGIMVPTLVVMILSDFV